MNVDKRLRATRDVYLPIPRPGRAAGSDDKYWTMCFNGLSCEYIKEAVAGLRKAQAKRGKQVSGVSALKTTSLQNAVAMAFGGHSYDRWREVGLSALLGFLEDQGMTDPTDLIRWNCRPRFADALTAQRLAERFFNSDLPLPKRLFTGVGSTLFALKGYGRLDIDEIAGQSMYCDQERLDFCLRHEDDVVLRADHLHLPAPDAPAVIGMTGSTLFLNAMSEYVGDMYNLLGDNLCDGTAQAPCFTSYGACARTEALNLEIFALFRKEIEHSHQGWVDVVPMPGNNNIVFLKGTGGAFDWVVREQRDEPFTSNHLYPVFTMDELPSALQQQSTFEASLYFKRGTWREQLLHRAQIRHYAHGGSAADWPGDEKLIQRKLIAEDGYLMPVVPRGPHGIDFVPHRLDQHCLMVSPLITIAEFWRFYQDSAWKEERASRLRNVGCNIEEDLDSVNLHDDPSLPASVTWFDAIAFCRDVERRTGLPVKLLDIEEWRDIAPPRIRDIEADGWGDLSWVITGGDGRTGYESADRHAETTSLGGCLRYGKDLVWSSNRAGLTFLSVVDFGEWLGDYSDGHAAAANAATGKALMTGQLEWDRCPAHLTMRYKGLKVGFRICYVAHPDA